jgi:DNA-binding HxlR family transcriptional regulator
MHEKSSGTPWSVPWIAERAIVLQVLRDDKDPRWTLPELHAEADDIDPAVLADALSRLEQHGIVVTCCNAVVASRCAVHLDDLGMVSI